jgi:photosystem II stability/assembly factor-like uncharacterized protein
MLRAGQYIGALVPFLVVGGLIYGGVYVKPVAKDVNVPAAVIERGDYMYGAAKAGDDKLIAVGSNGTSWAGTGAALSWSGLKSPLETTLQDVDTWDARRAVAVGDLGEIIFSGDGGASWVKASPPTSTVANKLLRVRTSEGGSAWAVGEAGAVLRSDDYGRTWVRARAEEDIAWNGVAVQGSRIWLVGEFGNISFSDNGGRSWSKQSSPVRGSLMAVAFKDASSGVAVGVDGVILATADGGASWKRQSLPAKDHFYDVIWNDGLWLAIGDKGLMATSSANAPAWRVADNKDNDRRWHTKILAYQDRFVLVGASVFDVNKTVQ